MEDGGKKKITTRTSKPEPNKSKKSSDRSSLEPQRGTNQINWGVSLVQAAPTNQKTQFRIYEGGDGGRC